MANNDIELNLGLSQASLKKFNKEYKNALTEAAKAGSLLSDAEKKNLQVLSEKVKNAKKLTDEYKKQLGILEKQKTAIPGRDIGGALKTMGGGLLGGAANILGSVIGGLVGFAIGGVKSAYEKYLTHQQALGSSIGMFSTAERNRGAYGSGGARYGYNLAEVAKMLPVMGRATGTSNVTELMQANRATGMDIGDVAETFGMLRQAGGKRFTRGAGGSQGAKEFTKLMSLGVQSGVEKARLPEYLAGLNKNVRAAAGLAAGDVNVSGMATELSLWGKISGKSGFQGSRGAALFGQVMQGIMKPGGGEFGEALMNQAFGFGKPGGTATFYEAQKAREAAASGDVGGIRKVMGEVGTQFGKGQEGALALRELLGVSLQQAEELQKIYDSDKSFEEKEEEMKEVMKGTKSLQEQANEMMKSQDKSLQHLATVFNEGAVAGADFEEFFRSLDKVMIDAFKEMKPLIIKGMNDLSKVLPIIPKVIKELMPMLTNIYDTLRSVFGFMFGSSSKSQKEDYFKFIKKIHEDIPEGMSVEDYASELTTARIKLETSSDIADIEKDVPLFSRSEGSGSMETLAPFVTGTATDTSPLATPPQAKMNYKLQLSPQQKEQKENIEKGRLKEVWVKYRSKLMKGLSDRTKINITNKLFGGGRIKKMTSGQLRQEIGSLTPFLEQATPDQIKKWAADFLQTGKVLPHGVGIGESTVVPAGPIIPNHSEPPSETSNISGGSAALKKNTEALGILAAVMGRLSGDDDRVQTRIG